MDTEITGSKLRDLMDLYTNYNDMNIDDRELELHSIISTALTEPEKIILFLYSEYASQRELAEKLNVSRNCVRKEINKIRAKIIENENNTLNRPADDSDNDNAGD